MKISVKSLAIAGAILWGSAILIVGLINLFVPAYGLSFLQGLSSVYPGFHDSRTVGSVAIATVDGLIDGGVAGLLLAWLYNVFTGVHRAA